MNKNQAIARLLGRKTRYNNLMDKIETGEQGADIGAMLGFYNNLEPHSGRFCHKCGQDAMGWAEYGIDNSAPLWISECCGAIHEMGERPNPDTLIEIDPRFTEMDPRKNNVDNYKNGQRVRATVMDEVRTGFVAKQTDERTFLVRLDAPFTKTNPGNYWLKVCRDYAHEGVEEI